MSGLAAVGYGTNMPDAADPRRQRGVSSPRLVWNATRKRAKVLLWDGTGLCIYAKRLEQGRFACLWREPAAAAPLRLTVSELQLFLEGSALVGRMPLSPAPFVLTAARRAPNSLGPRARA